MKKYTFLDFDGVISQMKRWFYGALKFIAVYNPYGDAFHGLFLLVSRKRDEQHESSCPNVPKYPILELTTIAHHYIEREGVQQPVSCTSFLETVATLYVIAVSAATFDGNPK